MAMFVLVFILLCPSASGEAANSHFLTVTLILSCTVRLLVPAAQIEQRLMIKYDLQVEPVELGENVTLPCVTPSSLIRAVEWTKTDLKEPEYVLFYSDGHLDGAHQHSSFRGRVDLLDRQMKNGDLTLSLRNMTSTDIGTYECRVSAGGSGRRKRAIIEGDPIRRVKLGLKHPDLQVELGQNVTLPCKTPSSHIRAVEWTKTDLEEPEYVLFYRDGHLDEANQHPSFKGRVDLLDRQMKNGDLTLSLSLRNVTSTDIGTYECRVSAGGSGRSKRANIEGDLISRVKLELKQHPGSTGGQTGEGGDKDGGAKDGGNTDRNLGLTVGLPVAVVLVAGVVGFLIYRKQRQPTEQDSYRPPPPDEEAGDQQLL